MDDIMYIPGLKKNLLSIFFLEDKGFRVIFMENQAYLWSKNQNLDTTIVFVGQEGGLYKVLGKLFQPWYIILSAHAIFGIGDSDISTSEHFLVCNESEMHA